MNIKLSKKKLYSKIFVLLFVSIFTINTPSLAESSVSNQIANLFAKSGISKESSSISVINIKTGQKLYDYNSNKPLAPASNMKLITSAAALALLKPEHKFKTAIYKDSNIDGGYLSGNVYLKSFGDPDLTTERLWKMVRKFKNTGVVEIGGNIIADDSYFDQKTTGEGWRVSDYGDSVYSARISALSLNRNTVEVWLRSGGKAGSKGVVTLDPENDFFQIDNQTVTGGGYSDLIVSRTVLPDGKNKIIVKGYVPVNGHYENTKINLDNPSIYTAYVFKKLLEKEGIKVKGTVKRGVTPSGAEEVVSSNSRTLSAIVYDFNKHSVNFIGEILLKYLGAYFKGAPGNAQKGAEIIKKEFFEKILKTDSKALVIADGSGLSPLNRITAGHFIKVLDYMYKDFGYQSDYIASLPLSGADGTLRKRTRKTAGERKFKAKTGFINGVSCLSGYTFTKDGEPIAFSIMMNNFSNMYSAISAQDEICTFLANTSLK
ncbi:MAG: D-alanyl-D-alanine carboxypeptidase/D-alanyl-D-alanine-endopeptidase [Candidatus Sericytochromatia bacterium]